MHALVGSSVAVATADEAAPPADATPRNRVAVAALTLAFIPTATMMLEAFAAIAIAAAFTLAYGPDALIWGIFGSVQAIAPIAHLASFPALGASAAAIVLGCIALRRRGVPRRDMAIVAIVLAAATIPLSLPLAFAW